MNARTPRSAIRALVTLALVLLAPVLSAAESVEEIFKRALFAEEGRRDFEAAVRDYQEVVRSMDEQRRLAATALFRLGECYRKLNRTNDAVAQYQRVVVEFPAEDTLVQISRQNLAALGWEPPPQPAPSPASVPVPANAPGSIAASPGNARQDDTSAISRLEQELTLLEAQLDAVMAMTDLRRQRGSIKTFFPVEARGIAELETRLGDLEIQNARLESSLAPDHPDRMAVLRQAELLKDRLRQETDDVLAGQSIRRDVLRTTLKQISASRPATGQSAATGAVAEATPLDSSASPATKEEDEEIRRIQAMVANSPDLINSSSQGKPWPLYAAAQKGQLAVAKYLLDHGAKTSLGNQPTPLHAAAQAGHKAMVELLLERGAPVDARTIEGVTPLHLAARAGFTAIPEVLLGRGADPNAAVPRPANQDGDSWSYGGPLNAAVGLDRIGLIRLLLEKGADPNSRDEGGGQFQGTGNPALYFAVSSDAVQLLLAKGADPNLPGRQGITRLNQAARNGEMAVLELLLKAGAWPDGPTNSAGTPSTPLIEAVRFRKLAAAARLLEAGASIDRLGAGTTPLHVALGQSDFEGATWLLERGANPNLAADGGVIPLELALNLDRGRAGKSSPPGSVSVPIRSVRRSGAKPPGSDQESNPVPGAWVTLLLEAGADVDRPFSDGWRLVHHLAYQDMEAVAWEEFLVEEPDVNARGPRQVTALMVAVCRNAGDSLKALLKAGADVNAQDELGNTALHFAAHFGSDYVRWLVDAKANPAVTNQYGNTPVDLLRQPWVGFHQQDRLGVLIPKLTGPMPVMGRPDLARQRRSEELLRFLGAPAEGSPALPPAPRIQDPPPLESAPVREIIPKG